jgi:hypothetical protein
MGNAFREQEKRIIREKHPNSGEAKLVRFGLQGARVEDIAVDS